MAHDARNDEAHLIGRCVKKDRAAWGVFVERYSPLIRASIKTRLKRCGIPLPVQDVEEIGQEVILSIWRDGKLKGLKSADNISYWLAIVSANAAISYVRRRMRREPVETVSLFENTEGGEMADIIPAGLADPGNGASRNELREGIEFAVKRLPQRERLVIKLNLLHGKRYDEISGMLRLPSGTVSSCVKRAKERLRRELKRFLQ